MEEIAQEKMTVRGCQTLVGLLDGLSDKLPRDENATANLARISEVIDIVADIANNL